MISTLTGRVTHIGLDQLVLDVHGVGFCVRTTPEALASTRHGGELTLHTELVVREDAMTLYGFPEREEADIFRLVQSVSGIGPRIALAVLTVLEPEELRRAVAEQDAKAIARTPGIGPKVASRMILELGGKLAPPTASAAPAAPAPAATSGVNDDVVEALISLGWPDKAARNAVDAVHEEIPEAEDAGVLLRASLRRLGSSR
ncbi:Holliday junction branch migration protein RuvA [Brachybacterium timonense]|uniref:Holliday junction branch migration protein RuvA n=1 Tax=Brachybacterium timonense TaxID=2050896 RepID=UPI000D0BA2A0|nr:Holliday junction branch migration protein RuvA [Brachybacterium timonense]